MPLSHSLELDWLLTRLLLLRIFLVMPYLQTTLLLAVLPFSFKLVVSHNIDQFFFLENGSRIIGHGSFTGGFNSITLESSLSWQLFHNGVTFTLIKLLLFFILVQIPFSVDSDTSSLGSLSPAVFSALTRARTVTL